MFFCSEISICTGTKDVGKSDVVSHIVSLFLILFNEVFRLHGRWKLIMISFAKQVEIVVACHISYRGEDFLSDGGKEVLLFA